MRFSRRLSRYFTLALIGGCLSSCAYIIPPSPNDPRNNSVEGGMRKPLNNPPPSNRRSELAPRELPVSAPVMPVQQAALQPAENTVTARTESAKSDSVVPKDSGRRVPVENLQFQLSANSYPPIHEVPQAPAMRGDDSVQSRLNAAQAELEVERSKAVTAADALVKDAAAEPSMLSELPKIEGVVPANDPIQVMPTMQQDAEQPPAETRHVPIYNQSPRSQVTQGVAPLASVTPPVEAQQIAMSRAVPMETHLPNIPVFAPPVALTGRMADPVLAVRAKPALQPVVSASSSAVTSSQSLPMPVAAQLPNVRGGDFDPLAVADNAPIAAPAANSRVVLSPAYVSNRYIPPSRYSSLRQ